MTTLQGLTRVREMIPVGTQLRILPSNFNYAVTDSGWVFSLLRKPRRLSGHRPEGVYRYHYIGGPYRRVHHLVLEAFVGPRPESMECRHLDGNKDNNHISNLSWGTMSENQRDRYKHGGNFGVGERHGASKLTTRQALRIKRCGDSTTTLSREYGVTRNTINDIRSGRRWAHLHSVRAALREPAGKEDNSDDLR